MSRARAYLDEVVVRAPARPVTTFAPSSLESLQVAEFNIERGMAFESIDRLLTRCESFGGRACEIARADLLLLVETDEGVCRTGYRAVAEELAETMDYHVAYATEFIELQPELLGGGAQARAAGADCERFDARRVRNRHGDAILSRYPIRRAERIALPTCYDWFEAEISRQSTVSGWMLPPQPRRGERIALLAEIELPSGSSVIVINAHLENKSDGACRALQMERILDVLRQEQRDGHTPVILGGDWNTTNFNGGTWNPLRLPTREPLFAALEAEGFDLSANDGRTTMVGALASRVLSRVDYLSARGFCGPATQAYTHVELAQARPLLSDHLPISASFHLCD
jgi:endonuclease/exonuclease/phosphatase family metal-dependent hydrolase